MVLLLFVIKEKETKLKPSLTTNNRINNGVVGLPNALTHK